MRLRRIKPPRKAVTALTAHMASRNAMEVCIFAVLLVSSIRTALGIRQLPGSLAHTGFPWGQVAASTLCLGCALALAGLFWPHRDNGIALEAFGLAMTCFGSMFYAVAIFVLAGFDNGVFAIGMALGIALACAVRWSQIQLYVQHRKTDCQ